MREKEQHQRMTSVSLDLSEDKVRRMMEICQANSPSTAVRIMAYHALWMFDAFGAGFAKFMSSPDVERCAEPFPDTSHNVITYDELLLWRDNEAKSRGFGVIPNDKIEMFWRYLQSNCFMNSEHKAITRQNVFRTYRAWNNIREREDRQFKIKLEEEAKAAAAEEEDRFRRNRILLRDSVED